MGDDDHDRAVEVERHLVHEENVEELLLELSGGCQSAEHQPIGEDSDDAHRDDDASEQQSKVERVLASWRWLCHRRELVSAGERVRTGRRR